MSSHVDDFIFFLCCSFSPRCVLDEILNLIESVFEGFPSYFFNTCNKQNFSDKDIDIIKFVRRFQTFIGGILT